MESKRLQVDAEAGPSGPPLKQMKVDLITHITCKSDSCSSGTVSGCSGMDQKKSSQCSGKRDDDDDNDGDDDDSNIEEDDDDDDVNEVILNYKVQHESDKEEYNVPTLDDGVDVPRKMECHQLFAQPTKDAFDLFNIKQHLVHHDYILFPYCLDINGVMERISDSRVSQIIRTNFQDSPSETRYEELQVDLKILARVLDKDTSTREDVMALARTFNEVKFNAGVEKMSQNCLRFGQYLLLLFRNVRFSPFLESDYRNMFSRFLEMIATKLGYNVITESFESPKITIEYPLKKCEMTLSGRTDIVVQHIHGRTVLLVECKRYRPVNIVYSSLPLPNPDGKDFKKLKPKLGSRVSFSQAAETADNADIRKKVRENMYKDLEKNICRHLKPPEEGFFGKAIAQMVGELLAWFDTMATPVYLQSIQDLPHLQKKKKMVRYGICQIGFKIIFVTIGINSDYIGKYPYLKIGTGQVETLGVDAFMTRPFDLMKADDRSIIADIIFAMLSYCS